MVERRRREQAPQAQVTLDEKGRILEGLLPGALGEFEPEIAASFDLVEATVKPDCVPSVCSILKENPDLAFDFLLCLCVVDYEEQLQVVYHLYSTVKKHKMVLKASVPTEEPSIPSVISVWPGADWFEREGHDLFGVVFEGHPNMTPLLLYEGFEGFPGRKSYEFNDYTEW